MKRLCTSMLALLIAGILAIGLISCAQPTQPNPGDGADGYLVMEINPSIEFVLSGNVISEVRALNEDGRVLLVNETLVGLTVEAAAERVVALAEQLGYLNETNYTVRVTLATANENAESSLMAQIEAGASKGSSLAQVQPGDNTQDQTLSDQLQEQDPTLYADMSPAKICLIQRIMQFDVSMTYEKGAAYSVHELAEMLDNYFEIYEDMYDDLEDRFEALYEQLEDEYEEKVIAVYDSALALRYRLAKQLEQALDALEDRIEAAGERELSQEDLDRVLTLLGLSDTSAFGTDVRMIPSVIEDYMEKNGVPDRIEDQVEDILDRYESDIDEDDYILSAEDALAFIALGQDVVGWSLDRLDDAVDDLEDGIEQQLRNAALTDEQRQQIAALRDEMAEKWYTLRQGCAEEIQQFKQELLQIKEQLLANKG